MRIALNAHLLSFAASYRQAGISRFIHSIIHSLQEADQENEYIVFLGDRRLPAGYLYGRRWQAAFSRFNTGSPLRRILWEQLVQPWAARQARADLLHDLAFVAPLLTARPTVLTVYDLTFVLFPGAFNRLNRRYLSLMTPLSARRARRVIAISESTKRDLVRLAGVPAEKIDVVYPALEPDMRRASAQAVAAFRRQRGLPERYILYVGTLEPRKNAVSLVHAYGELRRRQALPHRLVLAGGKGWRYENIFAAIEEYGLRDDVLLPGYVADEELPLWYSAAEMFVYPSLYEGFGLPVLEAMACGAPVITSSVSSLPEVVGDAGLLVEPTNVAQLADSIMRVAANDAVREEMTAKGMARASQFSRARMAEETLAVYRRASV